MHGTCRIDKWHEHSSWIERAKRFGIGAIPRHLEALMDPEALGQALAVIADKAQFLVQAQDTVIHFLQKWKLRQKIRTSYLMMRTENRKFNMTTSCTETTTALRSSHQSTKQAKRSDDPPVYLATAAEAPSQAKPHRWRAGAAEASTEA